MFKLWREVVECFGAIFKGLVCQSSVYMTYMMIWYPKSVGEHCPELEGCNCKCWGDCSRRGTHFWDISEINTSTKTHMDTRHDDLEKVTFFWHFFFGGIWLSNFWGARYISWSFQREIRQLPPENLKRTPTLPGNLRVPYPPQCHPSPGNSSP